MTISLPPPYSDPMNEPVFCHWNFALRVTENYSVIQQPCAVE